MDTIEDTEVNINKLLNNENAFYKLMLKIRSVLSKKDVKEIYNSDLLGTASKTINKDRNPVLNFKTKELDYGFYQKIVSLKEAASYFAQYLNFSEETLGEYFVILASIATPEFSVRTNQITDPSNFSESEIDNPHVQEKLIQTLDDCLKTMNDATRASLFQSVYQTMWFINFIKLPYDQLIGVFQKRANGIYVCPFNVCYDIFNQFVPVLINRKDFSPQMFNAMFDFAVKKNLIRNSQGLGKEEARKQFVEKCTLLTNNITEFYSNDEVLLIARVINGESNWAPEKFELTDDWLSILKASWSNDVLRRWKEWVQDIRKKRLKETISQVFTLSDFPLFDNRPWTELRSNNEFSKELTCGLIFWFVNNMYDDTIAFLRRIQKEGDFVTFAGKNSWSEGINLFEVSSTNILDLSYRLAPTGKFGQVFAELATGKMQYFRAQTQIENLMTTIEKECQQIVNTFLKGIKILDSSMDGIETFYGTHGMESTQTGLKNYESIGGVQHEEWKKKLHQIHNYIKHLVYLISELLLIDGISYGVVDE